MKSTSSLNVAACDGTAKKVVEEASPIADWLDVAKLQDAIREHVTHLIRIADALPAQMALLEAAAAGQAVDRTEILTTTRAILNYVCRGIMSPKVDVPKEFWLTPLGLAIARAHTRVIADAEVMSQAEAAQFLGVSREYISQLVEGGKVATVVREAAAPRSRKQPREMLYRASVEALRPSIRSERERRVKEASWNDGQSSDYAEPQNHPTSPPDEA